MEKYRALDVFIDDLKVGTLATYKERYTAFEYSDEWLRDGFAISPISLPIQKKVYLPKIDPFDGLFGVFADSLPDGWGRLLVDRMLLKANIDPQSFDMLNRLAIVGSSGMGALTYRPVHLLQSSTSQLDYDRLADECSSVLKSEYSSDLDALFALGGSSGGARPKILTKIDGEEWIVKFPATMDRRDIGENEYRYMLCAKACGIETSEIRLLPSKHCAGYFGTKRFDRQMKSDGTAGRIHMLSVSAILETSHRIPNLDYNTLMTLTLKLCKDYSQIEKLFRLMCFNVFAHNRDDHAKNFAYLYDHDNARWLLAPAYDLTYSNSLGGEHATCINGNGRNPMLSDILAVADKAGLAKTTAKRIAEHIKESIDQMLGDINQYQ